MPLCHLVRRKIKTNHDSLTDGFLLFTGLSVSFVIGQIDYFVFSFTTLKNRKPALFINSEFVLNK